MGRTFLFRLLFGCTPAGLRASAGEPRLVGLTPAEACRGQTVHRTGAVLSQGHDHLGAAHPAPPKLSNRDALRQFGVIQGE